jgi:hypothetical protein
MCWCQSVIGAMVKGARGSDLGPSNGSRQVPSPREPGPGANVANPMLTNAGAGGHALGLRLSPTVRSRALRLSSAARFDSARDGGKSCRNAL